MKKTLAGLVIFFLLTLTVPLTAEAQKCRTKRYKKSNVARYYDGDRYYDRRGDRYERRRSVYRRHRNLINIGIGAGAGAIVGGLIGGKRGAVIGAATGAGAGAAYTYGINPKKKRRYYRRR